jgi:hypothetical protein
MIKKSEQLFHLIKSLTREEKRHFKLYVNKYSSDGDNNYIKLFNAIDKQENFDEAAIKAKFKNETFAKQLTVTKNYLQKLIIRSLQDIHYDQTIDLKLLMIHHQISVLFKKGHYEICRDLVKKGIEIAAANDYFLEWIGLLKWDIVLKDKLNAELYKSSLSEYLEKSSQLLSWYDITTQGHHLENQLQFFMLNISNFYGSNDHYQQLIARIESMVSRVDLKKLPIKARYNLLFPLAQSYLVTGNYTKSFEIYSTLQSELKNGYNRRGLNEQYINVVTGLIYASGGTYNQDAITKAMTELKSIPETSRHISYRKAESLAFYPLINCTYSGDFYKGLTAIEIMNEFLDSFADLVSAPQFLFAYYFSASIYMLNNNFTQALSYLRKMDLHQKKEALPNIKLASQVMEIVIFYEQHKLDLVESRLRSLNRYLHKQELVRAYILVFIKYFSRLALLHPEDPNASNTFNHFATELTSLAAEEQIFMFLNFDLISWIESKQMRCLYGDRVKVNQARLFDPSIG